MRRHALVLAIAFVLACPAAFSDDGGPTWDATTEDAWKRQLDGGRGRCTMGAGYWHPRPEGPIEGDPYMLDPSWGELLAGDRAALADFLFSRLGSLVDTGIHACPHGNATEGEMAVYALQHLTRHNWTEIESTAPVFKTAKADFDRGMTQWALQSVLADSAGRVVLRSFFAKRIAEMDQAEIPASEGVKSSAEAE